jgi:hypothetical protein
LGPTQAQFELGRVLDRKLARLLPLEDPVHVVRGGAGERIFVEAVK